MITQNAHVSVTTNRQHAIATLTAAFKTDPVVRWVWPSDEQYARYFPPFVAAFAGGSFDSESAFCVEEHAAVALWLPPGVASDEEAMAAIAEESIAPSEQAEVFEFLGQQAAYHPHEPHWYLPLIGVDPRHQGRGHGSALLEHALRIADQQRLPAYLEATSERNRALYGRYGFEVTGAIQHGSSPTMWPMLRRPR